MKKALFSVAISLSTFLVAAPKPEWIPAKADLAAVAVGMDQKKTEIEEAYKTAFKAVGIDLDVENKNTQQQLAEACPGLDVLIKELLGISDDWKSVKAQSMVVSAILPTSEDADDGKVFIFVEYPGFNQDTTDAALKKILEKDQKANVIRAGAWSVAESKEKDDDDVFMGYRAIPGGYVVAVTAKQADADAHVAGKTPLAKDSPLQKLFVGLPKQGSRVVVADVKGLVKRYADGEDLLNLQMQAPWLLTLGAVTVDTTYEGTTAVVTLSAQLADAKAATALRDVVISTKTMFASFVIPQFTGNPNSAIAKLCLNQATCETKDSTVSLKITCTPDEAAAIVKELKAFQPLISVAPSAEIGTADDLEDLDIEDLLEVDDDDDEEDALTPEEARKILDSIN